jgi:hypothetical protein
MRKEASASINDFIGFDNLVHVLRTRWILFLGVFFLIFSFVFIVYRQIPISTEVHSLPDDSKVNVRVVYFVEPIVKQTIIQTEDQISYHEGIIFSADGLMITKFELEKMLTITDSELWRDNSRVREIVDLINLHIIGNSIVLEMSGISQDLADDVILRLEHFYSDTLNQIIEVLNSDISVKHSEINVGNVTYAGGRILNISKSQTPIGSQNSALTPSDLSKKWERIRFIFSFCIALIFALAIAVVVETRDKAVKNVESLGIDNEKILGWIPLYKHSYYSLKKILISLIDDSNVELNRIKEIYANFLNLFENRTGNTICFVGTQYGEGKSSIMMALAFLFSNHYQKICIISNNKSNTVEELFRSIITGIDGSFDAKAIQNRINRINHFEIGNETGFSYQKLDSQGIEALKREYDVVLIELSPDIGLDKVDMIIRETDYLVQVVRIGVTISSVLQMIVSRYERLHLSTLYIFNGVVPSLQKQNSLFRIQDKQDRIMTKPPKPLSWKNRVTGYDNFVYRSFPPYTR